MENLKLEGYLFQLAMSGWEGNYSNWSQDRFSFSEPHVPKGAIRNLRAVYSTVDDMAPAPRT